MRGKLVITVEMKDDGVTVANATTEGRLTGTEHGLLYAGAITQIMAVIRNAVERYEEAGSHDSARLMLAACTAVPAGEVQQINESLIREI